MPDNGHQQAGQAGGEVARTEVHQIVYAWSEQSDGFAAAGTSLQGSDHHAWDTWLDGWQYTRQRGGIQLPHTSLCYLTNGSDAAVIHREQQGADSRRDVRTHVLVGKAGTLTARWALRTARLDPWPGSQLLWTVQPAAATAGPVLLEPFPVPAPDPHRDPADENQTSASVRAALARSSGSDLATLIAAVLQRQRHRDTGQRHQLAAVGPDEPRARDLLWALTDVLPPSMSWSSFSSFEADFPNVSNADRTPDLLFMPDYQSPQPGVSAPTAYVFLDRTRRPHDRNILEFGSSQADPDNLLVSAARALVLAYLRPDDKLRRITHESASAENDVAGWASSVVRNAQLLGIDLNSWQEPDRSMAPSAPPQPRAINALPHTRTAPVQQPASDVPSTDKSPVWPIPQPSARLGPAEAESVLRNGIHAMGRRKIPDDRHTVDALIDALETRSLISQHEADILHPVLVRLLRGLPGTATRPSRHEARHNASSRHSPNRSVPVGKLIAYANGSSEPTRNEIIEALVSSLMLFDPPETRVRLRNALESLVDPHPHSVEKPTPKIDTPPIPREAVGLRGTAPYDSPINDPLNVIDALGKPRPPDEPPATSARDDKRLSAATEEIEKLKAERDQAKSAATTARSEGTQQGYAELMQAWQQQIQAVADMIAIQLEKASSIPSALDQIAEIIRTSPGADGIDFDRLNAAITAATQQTQGAAQHLDPDTARRILDNQTSQLKTLAKKKQIKNPEYLVNILVTLNPLQEFLSADDRSLLAFKKTVEDINRKLAKNDQEADGANFAPSRMRAILDSLDRQGGVFIALILVALILGVVSILS